ncbi:hypothetical protein AJ80_03331 [Polytolypa hystricis UAMH7299]|uniref:FeS cluster biogenesis domain-containing protein n=1 Tax=Polytolypa hystricis (strain UAMH7299) TaxID=1447883 RepID=A0A2B7YBH5_POLH7|nr:hypothetical protein AJ80_03331 [Polytolypa hystricis UAMH7299]
MSQKILSSARCRLARSQSSPAALFLQQFRRSFCVSRTATYPISQYTRNHSNQSLPAFLLPSRDQLFAQQSPALPQRHALPNQRVLFSSTATTHATSVLLNPRVNDDGKPMLIEISPRAAQRLREITDPSSSNSSTLTKQDPSDHLRVTVTSGGCHGFQYLMTLDPASKIDPEEDTIFEADRQDPENASSSGGVPAAGGAKVVMDLPSLELLEGSTVDYTMELIGSQFKITNNPRATSSCGCGTSFDVPE